MFIKLSILSLCITGLYALQALPKFNVDINETSVSGLSSGGFFAVQIQVAFSSIIKGAGIVAGGPYDCAGETLYSLCMFMGAPLVSLAIQKTKLRSGSSIDNSANLAHQKVMMISGTKDMTVATSVMNQLYKYYTSESNFIPVQNIEFKKDLVSGHTFPTDFDSTGNNQCATTGSPYISNCEYDGAGAILQQIYGNLKAKKVSDRTGSFIEVDQKEFISSPAANGLGDKAFLYVPKACADGEKCRLHIAFHGCSQSYATIGDKFVKNTGYDRWADDNNILVLFPQTNPDYTMHLTPANYMLNNPNGCWDWIGWYGGADFSTKNGVQMQFIKKMIDRIAGN